MSDAAARGARATVAIAFFVNGAALASWAPRIPQVRDALDLSPAVLGWTLACVSVGAVAGALGAGAVGSRGGSRGVTVAASLLLASAIALPGHAGSALQLALGLGLVGVADGALDAAMNDLGAGLERHLDRPIMNRLHAWWSVGAGVGGVAGSVAAGLGVSVAWHLAGVGVVLAALALAAGPSLPRWPGAALAPAGRFIRVGHVAVWLTGATVLAAVVEDVPIDWSAVYVAEQVGASSGVAGGAYAAFAVAMAVSRWFADRQVADWGAARVTSLGAALVATGLAAALFVPRPGPALVGFALVGAGSAPIFPFLFARAARTSGAWGTAAVSAVSRVGFFAAPALIGMAAEVTDLRAAPALGLVGATVLAFVVRSPQGGGSSSLAARTALTCRNVGSPP